MRIAIIVGSTRPGRKSAGVAQWVDAHAAHRPGAQYEIVDLQDYALPHLDETTPAIMGRYENDHTQRWAAKVAEFDGFIFVTPEYNHGIPGALKDAIDFVYAEWADKAAGFVSYGVAGGIRAAEQLRLNLATVQIATVSAQVTLSLTTDFDNGDVQPSGDAVNDLNEVLTQTETWAGAMRTVRTTRLQDAAA